MSWASIRGGSLGVGPQRQDFHAAWIAFHSQQRSRDATLVDYMMPWISIESVAEEEDED
jgi:hypothetical protein